VRLEVYRKIVNVESLASLGQSHREAGRVIVHCHGCFDVVHPGHVRYLEHAGRQGDILIVSLTGDDAIEKADGTRPYIPERYRAENLAALAFVDHVVVAEGATAEPIIRELRPNLYVKGKEYEGSTHPGFLSEKSLVESLGGQVMFSSGEVVFSSSAIIESFERKVIDDALDADIKLSANLQRWELSRANLHQRVTEGFAGLRVAVVGDSLCDRYVQCESTDVASEAPILSVKPTRETSYLGAAAIIAVHLKGLGAEPHLITCVGRDAASKELLEGLDELGVEYTALPMWEHLPVKQRFLVEDQKLLKVDRGEATALDGAERKQVMEHVLALGEVDAVVFADFGYGTVSQGLLAELVPQLRSQARVLAGHISGPRRSLLAMEGFELLTPTERELRSVMGDFEGSLPTVAAAAMERLSVPRLVVNLGKKGCVLFHPRHLEPGRWFEGRLRSDYLPSLAPHHLDVVGANEAMLAATTLACTAEAGLPESAYLGSLASALAVGRLGNVPIGRNEFLSVLDQRKELNHPQSWSVAG